MKDPHPDAPHIKVCGVLNGFDLDSSNAGTAQYTQWEQTDLSTYDYYGYDRYNPWSSTNGKQYISVDRWLEPGLQLIAWGWGERIVIGEWGVREYTTAGVSAQWMQDALRRVPSVEDGRHLVLQLVPELP